mmetsp:Transcript_14622/g.25273  ORF Transcript_14622/g.25273 Transcript_14622/m.25273 type:complete len:419 (+) Transcript_14622:319-1575(+)
MDLSSASTSLILPGVLLASMPCGSDKAMMSDEMMSIASSSSCDMDMTTSSGSDTEGVNGPNSTQNQNQNNNNNTTRPKMPASKAIDIVKRKGEDDARCILLKLPDELLSHCMLGLSADDMAALQLVNHRMHDIVRSDSVRWRDVFLQRFECAPSTNVFDAAVAYAGGWKEFYAEKIMLEKAQSPWRTPCSSESKAIRQIILKGSGMEMTSSPVSPLLGGMDAMPLNHGSASGTCYDFAMIILIDGSSSVTEEDFKTMREFSMSMIQAARDMYPSSAIALLQFNQFPRVELAFSSVHESLVIDKVQHLDQMMGSTDISAPVKRGLELFEEVRALDKAMMLLTDGQTHSDELRQTERLAAMGAAEQGVRFFTLGVGRDIDENGLSRIADASRRAHTEVLKNTTPSHGAYFALRKYIKYPN